MLLNLETASTKSAKQVYGNGAKYNMIHEANRNVIGNNPNLIYPGQKFYNSRIGDHMYSVILRNSIKLDNLKMEINLSESIDSIAYTADIKMVVPEEMSKNLLLKEGIL